MGNTYYAISVGANTIADIRTALVAKFGAYHVDTNPQGFINHNESSSSLIFTCLKMSNKVIKFTWSSSRLTAFYGDAHTSGTTVTNQKDIATSAAGTTSAIHLVLGDDFMFLPTLSSTINGLQIYIGKLSNDEFVAFAAYQATARYGTAFAWNTTRGVEVLPLVSLLSFKSAAGKLFTKNVHFCDRKDGLIAVNTDGTAAYPSGIKNISASLGETSLTQTNTYIITSGVAGLFGSRVLFSSLFVEYDPIE